MNETRRDQPRSPFKQRSTSSPSLDGMEKPLRSFKSFIKGVPPRPIDNNKPLPPTPAENAPPTTFAPLTPILLDRRPSSSSQDCSGDSPQSRERRPSASSWKVPDAWGNEQDTAPDIFSAPEVPSTRAYSLILPEPSPDLSEGPVELQLASPRAKSPKPPLMPIYESRDQELGAPSTPPRSPLPPPPTPHAIPRQGGQRSPARPSAPLTQQVGNFTEILPPTDTESRNLPRPTVITTEGPSDHHPPLQEKASAFLGLGSPEEVPFHLQRQHVYDTTEAGDFSPEIWHLQRGKSLRRKPHESPLTDSWEEEEMDEKLQQLSFAQDYHELLSQQYRDSMDQPRQEQDYRPAKLPYPEGFKVPQDPRTLPLPSRSDLVPRPLSWQKSSIGSTPRRTSPSRREHVNQDTKSSETPPEGKRTRHSYTSWVPRHLSIGPSRERTAAHKSDSSRYSDRDRIHHEAAHSDLTGQQQAAKPKSSPKRLFNNDDYRFLFSPKRKTSNKTNPQQPRRSSSPTPILRLPGKFAVVRTSSPSKPPSKPSSSHPSAGTPSEPRSPTGKRPSTGSHYTNSNPSIRTNSPSYRHSYHSGDLLPSTRHSGLHPSCLPHPHSQRSSGSSPLGHEVPRPASLDEDLSHDHDHFPDNEPPEEGQRSHGILSRARNAREKRKREARQRKLKESIRVLGPTDPRVVGGDVERRPGYLGEGGMI